MKPLIIIAITCAPALLIAAWFYWYQLRPLHKQRDANKRKLEEYQKLINQLKK